MAQGGGQAGGMGASPMGSSPMGTGGQGMPAMGGQMQGLGSAPMGGGMGGFGGPGPYSPGMQTPMNSTNMTTQQNIMGAPMQGMGSAPMGVMSNMGGGFGGQGPRTEADWNRYSAQVFFAPGTDMAKAKADFLAQGQGMGGMGQPMQSGFDRMPIQGGGFQPQNTIPGRSDFAGMGLQGNDQNIMQLLNRLGFQMPGGVPQMQTPFTQQGQPQVTQAATAQPQPPVMPQPAVLPQRQTPQPVAASREAQRLERQQSRDLRRNRRSVPAPTPTDFSRMGQAGQFGTQGFAQGLQDYLGKNYSGYGYNPTNQTFYSGADRGGQTLTLDQALQQGRAAGFQMASGGIASLRRR